MNFNRIIIVQTLFLGDLILTLPFIRQVKELYPNAIIDVLIRKGNEGLLVNNPFVNSIILYDNSVLTLFHLIKTLRQNNYDLAFIFPGSIRSAFLAYFAQIPRRIGTDQSTGIKLFINKVKFPAEAWKIPGGRIIKLLDSLWKLFGKDYSFVSSLYTDVVKINPSKHIIERNFQLLEPLCNKTEYNHSIILYPRTDEINEVNNFLDDWINLNEKLIAIAPGSQWETKRWLTENYVEVIRRLIKERYKVVLIGGKTDEKICNNIFSAINTDLVKNACSKLSILGTAILLSKCRLLLTNDSAAMHLGAAMGISCIIIMGPTIPEFGYVPKGNQHKVIFDSNLWCRPCTPFGGRKCPTGTFDCMKRITTDRVFDIIKAELERPTN